MRYYSIIKILNLNKFLSVVDKISDILYMKGDVKIQQFGLPFFKRPCL